VTDDREIVLGFDTLADVHPDFIRATFPDLFAAAESRGRSAGYAEAVAKLRNEDQLGPFVVAWRERERNQRPIKGYAPSNIVLADYLEASSPSTEEPNHG
jgi:hypothetical protein